MPSLCTTLPSCCIALLRWAKKFYRWQLLWDWTDTVGLFSKRILKSGSILKKMCETLSFTFLFRSISCRTLIFYIALNTEDGSVNPVPQILYDQYLILPAFGSYMF